MLESTSVAENLCTTVPLGCSSETSMDRYGLSGLQGAWERETVLLAKKKNKNSMEVANVRLRNIVGNSVPKQAVKSIQQKFRVFLLEEEGLDFLT